MLSPFVLWTKFDKLRCPDFICSGIELSPYRGFSITLPCSNVGITGATICDTKSNDCYYYDIEGWNLSFEELLPYYLDENLHVPICEKKIDDLIKEALAHPSKYYNATQLNLFTIY